MASSIGTSHIASAQPCQDSHFHLDLEDSQGRPVTVLVASDGAGTASVADVGAMLTCRTFARLVGDYLAAGGQVENIRRPLVARWIAGIVYRLSMRAKADGLECQDYACTLLAAVAGATATAFIQIGDGAMVVSGPPADGWNYVFWPQHGEFANTTNFVTSDNALEVLDFESTSGPVEEIAIFTDGIENLVLNNADKAVHAPFFDSMFKSVRLSTASGRDAALCLELEKYLSTPVLAERTSDDKTLILASRRRPTNGQQA
ncbi:MAG: PP2C family serine/threonine-protein phosphatase [Reyranellales bacterium]